jgi:hypothetical protein
VLYVDLSLTDAQFRARYLTYKFAANLYRERPPQVENISEWIRDMVAEHGFRVVVIDSLSALKRTHDGIRETLSCMRRLKQLRDELGVSILAVTDAFEPRDGWVSESDLMRSRVLCTVADSVFAIGRKRRPEGARSIVQTRSRAAKLSWTGRDAPECEIKRLENGMLAFEFDDRFEPEIDDKTLALVRSIHSRHSDGASFRLIGSELGISKSGAHKLYKRWKPIMASGQLTVDSGQLEDEDDHWDETEISDSASEWLEEESTSSPPYKGGVASASDDGVVLTHDAENHPPATAGPLLCKEGSFFRDPSGIPFGAGLGRRSICDLEFGFDAYGQEIYVESREEHTRRPTVWYQIDRRTTRRFVPRCVRHPGRAYEYRAVFVDLQIPTS